MEIPSKKISIHFITDPDTGLVQCVWRRFDLEAGAEHEGHLHSVDHGMVFHSGKFKLDWRRDDGTAEGSTIITAPWHGTVRKDVHHSFTCIEDGSWYCVFTAPDGYEEDLKDFWMEVPYNG